MADTAADLKRQQEQLIAMAQKMIDSMGLRQWAIRRAIQIIGQPGASMDADGFIDLAQRIHDFVATPVVETLKGAEHVD